MKQPETSDDPDDYAEEATTFTIPTAEELFDAYDDDGSGGLYLNEFRDILEDLDGLDGVPEKEKNEYIAQEFESADLNHDGMLNIDEFMLYYYGELCFKFPVGKNGHNPGAILYNIFVNYCSFGKGGKRSEEMESHQFLRLCQDCQLLNGRTFTKAGADLVFHFARAERVYRKQLGACKLQYDQFLHALLLVGERRKSGFEEVAARVLQHAGPKKFATMADFLVFTDLGNYEDDRSLERPKGLPQLKHRGVNDVLQKMKKTASAVAGGDGPGGNLNQSSATAGRMPPASAGLGGSQGEADLRSSIKTALFRQPPPAHSRSQELIGTGAVAADGEPSPVPDPEPSVSPDISQVMPGSKTARMKWHFDKVGAEVEEELTETFKKTGTAALQDSRVRHSLRTRSEDELTMALKRVFERYNKWEKGTNRAKMDRMRFHKVLRDAQLVKDADLPAGKVDTIFSQIRPTSEVQINFVQFMYGLRHVASEKRLSLNEVIECIVAVNAPISVVK